METAIDINPHLSICIPTYNRGRQLQDQIGSLVVRVYKHNIPLFISDNASTDCTGEVVRRWRDCYPHIYYARNERNFGFDHNVRNVLKMSTSRYAWLLSDDDRLEDGAVEQVLAVAESGDFDMIVVNGGALHDEDGNVVNGRVFHTGSAVFTDRNEVLGRIGWHMTWISSLIFGDGIRKKGNFDKFIGSQIIHFATVFDYLSSKDISVYWESRCCVAGAQEGLPSWLGKTLEIWGKNWFDTIQALPRSYSEEVKRACMFTHGVKASQFDLPMLFLMRIHGFYDYSMLRKYRWYLPHVAKTSLLSFTMIAVLPRRLIKRKIIRSLIKRLEWVVSFVKKYVLRVTYPVYDGGSKVSPAA